MQAEMLIHCQNELGEGPLWHSTQRCLYWLDILNNKVQWFDPISGKHDLLQTAYFITALCLHKENIFITAGELGFAYWDAAKNSFKEIGHPEEGKAEARFNDGKVDRAGRFWAGTMTTHDASSSLYRLDPDSQINTMVQQVTISNGLSWSPDNNLMYYADTLRYTIYVYDFDLDHGVISNKRTFVQFSGKDGAPDGMTIDQQGNIWCALWGGWRVECFSPEGKSIECINVPVAQPSSCAFGGEQLDTLYITSAQQGLSSEQLTKQPLAGGLFVCKPGVKGIAEKAFAG